MLKKNLMVTIFIFLVSGAGSLVLAHTPLCSCYDGGDGIVICEGGFSDGSSAAGVDIRVVDKDGHVLEEGKMDDFSEFIFDKPEGCYEVIFDAGPGHEVKMDSNTIAE